MVHGEQLPLYILAKLCSLTEMGLFFLRDEITRYWLLGLMTPITVNMYTVLLPVQV